MAVWRSESQTNFSDLWLEADNITREALATILSAAVPDNIWDQAKLSVEQGGTGLRSAVDHAPAAFVGSVMGAQGLVTELLSSEDFPPPPFSQDIMDTLTTVLSPVELEVSQVILAGYSQHSISIHIDLRNSHLVDTTINGSGDKREMARRRSLTLPYSGVWLNAVSNPALRTRLEPWSSRYHSSSGWV